MTNKKYILAESTLDEKKKKPYSSATVTTGNPQYNIDMFNKMLSGKIENKHTDGLPSMQFEKEATKAAEKAASEVGTFAAQSPDGASSISTGDSMTGNEAGAVGESLALKETVATSMPVTILASSDIKDFVKNNLTTNPTNPKLFKLGYIKEFTAEIPAKFKGGRGSAGQPVIRIFKCIEYSAIYTGIAYTHTDKTIAADTVLGTARHTGEKTGFSFTSGLANAFGSYADGSEALQVYLDDTSVQKIKYFVSIDDSDLAEIDRKDLVKYLTPAAATKLATPVIKAAGTDADGNAVFDRPVNRLKLANIYMIGNLGSSIM